MTTALIILFRVLEVMFLLGVGISMVIVIITTIEDLRVLFEKDTPPPGTGVAARDSERLAVEDSA